MAGFVVLPGRESRSLRLGHIGPETPLTELTQPAQPRTNKRLVLAIRATKSSTPARIAWRELRSPTSA